MQMTFSVLKRLVLLQSQMKQLTTKFMQALNISGSINITLIRLHPEWIKVNIHLAKRHVYRRGGIVTPVV